MTRMYSVINVHRSGIRRNFSVKHNNPAHLTLVGLNLKKWKIFIRYKPRTAVAIPDKLNKIAIYCFIQVVVQKFLRDFYARKNHKV